MYQIFTLIYIVLLSSKIVLLKRFDVEKLGDKVSDPLIVCAPAVCLLLEFHANRNDPPECHRPHIQAFDMFLQFLFVLKVLASVCKSENGRLFVEFCRSRLMMCPSPYA